MPPTDGRKSVKRQSEKGVKMVGTRIRALRAERRMTQEELAEKSGISRITISKLENGKTDNMSTFTALALASALEVSVAVLLCAEC